MRHNNLNTKNNSKVRAKAATTLLSLATTIILLVTSTPHLTALLHLQSAQAFIDPNMDEVAEPRKAPTVVTGDNIYIVW